MFLIWFSLSTGHKSPRPYFLLCKKTASEVWIVFSDMPFINHILECFKADENCGKDLFTLNFGTGRESSVYLDHSLRGLGSRRSPTAGNPESWAEMFQFYTKTHLCKKKKIQLINSSFTDLTYWHAEMYSIISVDFLRDPSDGWVLNEFVAFPLQTDSFL